MPDPEIAHAIAVDGGILKARWRVGRKLGRTLYAETGGDDRNSDLIFGMVDSGELAKHIVALHNASLPRRH